VRTRSFVTLAAFLLAALAGSCAVTSETPGGPSAYAPPPQDPARAGLPPLYRAFFDELRDDGDWTLIEPYGWCFRPRENFVAWRPYQDGWWEPSDTYGWIWDTYEPFGWITYHYGSWFYDSYQGWVWQPGPVWGPAWVAWVESGDYVGWAPLPPAQYEGYGSVPGGLFMYAPGNQIAARDIGQNSLFLTQLTGSPRAATPIVNVGHANGVAFNRGPDFVTLQRMGAPIPERVDAATLPRVKLGAAPRPNESDLAARTNRVTTEGVRQWRAFKERGIAPPATPAGARPHAAPQPRPVARPGTGQVDPGAAVKPAPRRAPADTTAAGDRRGHGAERDSTRDR